jgi:exosortase
MRSIRTSRVANMNLASTVSAIRQRHLAFALLLATSVTVFWTPLRTIAGLSWSDDRYSHLLLIPMISAFLLYFQRPRMFSQPTDRHGAAFSLLLGAATVYALSALTPLGASDRLAGMILSAVLVWAGTFALCYGTAVLKVAAFPLGFLAFMIPVPESVLNWISHALQSASADTSAVLFHAIGMPSFRHGFRFQLPGLEIEIANECSGIRSTTALVLVSVLAGYIFLRSPSRRICFALAAIPIGIFKNAVRIVALSYLGVYVDRAYLEGSLHHKYGGLVFSSLSMLLVIPLIVLLRKSEARSKRPREGVGPSLPATDKIGS